MRHALIFVFIILFAAPTVNAVALLNLPSQREYTFEPGLKADISFAVGGGENLYVNASTPIIMHPETLGTPDDDNILNYVTVEDTAPGTGTHTVIVHIAMPEQMRPGFYPVNFIASEMQPGEAGGMNTVAHIAFQLRFWVLSDEKRLDVIQLVPYPTPEGLPANVSVMVASRTKKTIDAAVADINVYDNNGTLVTGSTDPISIAPAETTSLYTLVPTENLKGGDYLVNATVRYDGKVVLTGVETLKIGTLHVDVPEYDKNITYNTTNRFTFYVHNRWNKELQDVYALIDLQGQEQKKTASLNIQAFGNTQYEIYFDRDEAILPGTAIVNITINFKDYDPGSKGYISKTEKFSLPVEVILPPVPAKTPFFTPLVIAAISATALLIIMIIILIILLLRRPKERPPAAPSNPPVAPPIVSSASPQQSPQNK